MAPHQERVVAERGQLDERIVKLQAFVDGQAFGAVDREEQFRLRSQLYHMRCYRNVLVDRIEAFK